MNHVASRRSPWLHEFEQALEARDGDASETLFAEGAAWRDLLVLTWNFRQFHGRQAVGDYLWTVLDNIRPRRFELAGRICAVGLDSVDLPRSRLAASVTQGRR